MPGWHTRVSAARRRSHPSSSRAGRRRARSERPARRPPPVCATPATTRVSPSDVAAPMRSSWLSSQSTPDSHASKAPPRDRGREGHLAAAASGSRRPAPARARACARPRPPAAPRALGRRELRVLRRAPWRGSRAPTPSSLPSSEPTSAWALRQPARRGKGELPHDLAEHEARRHLRVHQRPHQDEHAARAELAPQPREQVRLARAGRTEDDDRRRAQRRSPRRAPFAGRVPLLPPPPRWRAR